MEDPPERLSSDYPDRTDEALAAVIPDSPNEPYDMLAVIDSVVDEGEFMQVHESFAPNILVGFARLDGRTVGIVANQPYHMAGVLDIDASAKAARFVRFCDAFNIPLLTFIDRARIHARHGAGARGDHQARREASLRVRRGDGCRR